VSALAATLLLVLAAGEPVPVNVPLPDAGAATAPAMAPAPSPLPPPELTLPRSGPGLGAVAAPAVLLAGLGLTALLLARRKGRPGRMVQVLETTSLGPKRSLVLARLGDEVLLLGSSEAGISLLRSHPSGPQPAPAPEPLGAPEAAPRPRPLTASRPEPAALASLVSRLRGARPPSSPQSFDAVLSESAEDQELRRKLARGQSGSVR
jgi:flagellar biogenesis protein FliO